MGLVMLQGGVGRSVRKGQMASEKLPAPTPTCPASSHFLFSSHLLFPAPLRSGKIPASVSPAPLELRKQAWLERSP